MLIFMFIQTHYGTKDCEEAGVDALYVVFVLFLPARRYASAGNSDRNVSVRPSGRLSVCLSVCHAPVLCQNEES